MAQTRSRIVPVAKLPRLLPFLGVAVRRRGQQLIVYIKTAPRRRWRAVLTCPLGTIPTGRPA